MRHGDWRRCLLANGLSKLFELDAINVLSRTFLNIVEMLRNKHRIYRHIPGQIHLCPCRYWSLRPSPSHLDTEEESEDHDRCFHVCASVKLAQVCQRTIKVSRSARSVHCAAAEDDLILDGLWRRGEENPSLFLFLPLCLSVFCGRTDKW